MKVLVTRDYSGEEGDGPNKDVTAGTMLTVTRARGHALQANGLVEIVEDDDADEAGEPEPVKQASAPANKRAREPRNKGAVA